MLVADSSALIAALIGMPRDDRLVARIGSDGEIHVPHLVDVEVLHALRRLERAGHIPSERAESALTDFSDLALIRYPHLPLMGRAWQLRQNLTAYDALFVSLAEALGVPLVTCDARIASAAGHSASVETYGT